MSIKLSAKGTDHSMSSTTSSSSSSSSISLNTVSNLRHQFDNGQLSSNSNINNNLYGTNKPYGSNVNRLRNVFIPTQPSIQQKRQKLNTDNDENAKQQQHQSRPIVDSKSATVATPATTVTSNSTNNNSRSRSLSTPRITTKQIFVKSNEEYDSPNSIDVIALQTNTNVNNIMDSLKNNDDHLTRFQSAKALFARIEEEAKQAKQFLVPTSIINGTPAIGLNNQMFLSNASNSRRSLNFNSIHNNSKATTTNHRLSSSNAYLFSSLPTSSTLQAQISPPNKPSSAVSTMSKRKNNISEENKENLKVEKQKNEPEHEQQHQAINYRFNNYLNGISNENEQQKSSTTSLITPTSPQRRSWTKLQPHSPSRRSLPASPNTNSPLNTSSSSSASPIQQQQQKSSSINEIFNQISSSKLLTNNSIASTPNDSPSTQPSPSTTSTSPINKAEDYPITSTTPYTIENSSSPESQKAAKEEEHEPKVSPNTPPSTPIINSLKIDLMSSSEELDNDSPRRRKLFEEQQTNKKT